MQEDQMIIKIKKVGKINEQTSEVQLKIEHLQLDNQNSQNEISTLGIVKDYLERVEESKN